MTMNRTMNRGLNESLSGGLNGALKLAGVLAALALPALLSACNTVHGAGEDLQQAADKTSEVLTGEKTERSKN